MLGLLIAEWLVERFPTEREGDLGKRLVRADLGRDAGRRGRAAGPGLGAADAGERPAAGLPHLGEHPGRCAGGGAGRALPRCRAARRRAALGAARMGRADGSATTGRRCRRRAGCRNGRWGAGSACRCYTAHLHRGPPHSPVFKVTVAARAGRRKARARPSGPPNRRRRRPGFWGCNGHERGPGPASHRGSRHRPRAARCGLVAVVGAPNAGKSTLVNALAGSKVTIVSPKPQTTRFRIRAVVMHAGAQIILVDTPGIFRRAGGWTAPWSPPPGAARRMPTAPC